MDRKHCLTPRTRLVYNLLIVLVHRNNSPRV